jgi:hypothetical protein
VGTEADGTCVVEHAGYRSCRDLPDGVPGGDSCDVDRGPVTEECAERDQRRGDDQGLCDGRVPDGLGVRHGSVPAQIGRARVREGGEALRNAREL